MEGHITGLKGMDVNYSGDVTEISIEVPDLGLSPVTSSPVPAGQPMETEEDKGNSTQPSTVDEYGMVGTTWICAFLR